MMPGNSRPRGREEGAVAVEAALTISTLMLMILGIVQFSLVFWQWNTMLLAVSQAGRFVMLSYAPTNTVCDAACAKTKMQTVLTSASASCADPAAPAGGQMCVNATVAGTNMTLTATYGFDLLQLTGPLLTITSRMQVPIALN